MKHGNRAGKLCRRIAVISAALLAVSIVAYAQGGRHTGPGKPTSTEMLATFGFEATPQGLSGALEDERAFAKIYALRVISERKDASYLDEASGLLQADEFVMVHLEAAKLLTQFDREEGLAWLRDWENKVGDDPAISTDWAHVVLDAASALAERGDERLARQVRTCFQHQSWSVKFHAARALGDFQDIGNPQVEQAWITSADVAIVALEVAPQVEADVIQIYLRWLRTSASRQTYSTPEVLNKFVELVEIDHSATSSLRQDIGERWMAKSPIER